MYYRLLWRLLRKRKWCEEYTHDGIEYPLMDSNCLFSLFLAQGMRTLAEAGRWAIVPRDFVCSGSWVFD